MSVECHQIEEVTMLDGRKATEAMFADGRPAWHGLGHTWESGMVPSSADVEEKMPSAFFEVKKEAIKLVDDRNGLAPAIEDNYALVRQDTATCLATVGNDYKVWQNREAFELLDGLQQDGIIKYETVVVLKGGKKVCMLARMPSVDTVVKGDHSFRYVLCTIAHGGGAITLTPTSIRVVCWNTLQMALGGAGKNKVSIRHSGDMKSKAAAAQMYLSQFDKQFTQYREDAQKLLVSYNSQQATDYLHALFAKDMTGANETAKKRAETILENKIAAVRETRQHAANQMPGVKNTWWGLFNAVTESIDHGKGGRESKDKRTALENKFLTITSGDMATFKAKAFKTAMEMAV